MLTLSGEWSNSCIPDNLQQSISNIPRSSSHLPFRSILLTTSNDETTCSNVITPFELSVSLGQFFLSEIYSFDVEYEHNGSLMGHYQVAFIVTIDNENEEDRIYIQLEESCFHMGLGSSRWVQFEFSPAF